MIVQEGDGFRVILQMSEICENGFCICVNYDIMGDRQLDSSAGIGANYGRGKEILLWNVYANF